MKFSEKEIMLNLIESIIELNVKMEFLTKSQIEHNNKSDIKFTEIEKAVKSISDTIIKHNIWFKLLGAGLLIGLSLGMEAVLGINPLNFIGM